MPTPPNFRRQLEAMLMVPSAQARAAAQPAPTASRAKPTEPAQPEPSTLDGDVPAVPPAPLNVPSYLRCSGLAEAVAETVSTDRLPIPRGPRDGVPFVKTSELAPGIRALDETPLVLVPRDPSGTIEASSLPIPRHALPFGPPVPEEAEPEAAATVVRTALPIPHAAQPFAPNGGSPEVTAKLPSLPIPRGESDGTTASVALPGPRTAPPYVEERLEGLTLTEYATLCADLAARPSEAEALFASRGLADVSRRRTVDAAWRANLASDRAAHERWQEIYRRRSAAHRGA